MAKQNNSSRKPLVISDPKEFAYRDQMYSDSLSLYNRNKISDLVRNNLKKVKPVWESSKETIPSQYVKKTTSSKTYNQLSATDKKNIDAYTRGTVNPNIKPVKYEIHEIETPYSVTTNLFGSDEYSKKKFKERYNDIPAPYYKKPIQPVVFKEGLNNNVSNKNKTVKNTITTKQPIKQTTNVSKENIPLKQSYEDIGTLPLRSINTEPTLNPQIIQGHYNMSTPHPRGKGMWSDSSKGNLPSGMTTKDFQRKNQEYQQQSLKGSNKDLYEDKIKTYPVPTSAQNITFADGGPLNDINNSQYLNSVYASALGNYYQQGGQFPTPYSLPEDSFKQGGNNLHNSVYASSPAQYPAPYALGGYMGESTRQQMYMPLDHVTKNGGSILSMSNTPQLEGEGKDLSEPKNSYIYNQGGPLNNHIMENGSKIHINPANRGKFTASAQHAGMGVQAFANQVLANKEDYSSTQVKRANFAHNAAGWNHQYGGNMYANGGPLTEFNEGGTHEENPLGGIPQGVAPDGGMNLVEQGETKLDSANYIFSDTLKVDKETAAGLGINNAVGKTFAELSKKMNRPNSRRENDTIEENAKKKDLDSLMQAQEEFKQKEAVKKLQEIQSLDPNLLGSLMKQGQGQPVEPQQDPNLMQQPMGSEQPGGQPPVDPAMQQMMAQQGGSLGGIVPMAMGGSLQHSYGLGGFGDVMRNYGLGIADTALSTLGAKNVVQDSAYKGQGSEFMRKASGIAGGIGGALLPMAANIVAPGMGGTIAGAAQQGIGMLDPEDERAKQLRMGDNNQNGVNQQQGLPIGVNYALGGSMHRYDVGGGLSFNDQLPLKSAYVPQNDLDRSMQGTYNSKGPEANYANYAYPNEEDSPEAIAEYEKFGMVKNENGDWVDKSTTPTGEFVDEAGNPITEAEYKSKLAKHDESLKDKNLNLNMDPKWYQTVGQALPAAYNIGTGLFEKAQQLNANDYYTKADIKPWEYNVDPELAAVREAYAGASAGLKNTMPGAGAYLTNRANLANQEAMSKKQVLANKQNIDAQNYMQAQLANKQIEGQNASTKLNVVNWNAQAKAAKRKNLQTGLSQLGDVAQNDQALNMQKAYLQTVSPDFANSLSVDNFAKLYFANQKAKKANTNTEEGQ